MAMELILKSAEVNIPQAIENIEYLKGELADQLEYYKSLIVTADGIKDGKADRAKLNKLRKAIDDQRKEVKKQVLALYEPFEKECAALLKMVDEAVNAIDSQLKAFDEQEKQEKRQALEEFFSMICSFDFVKLDDVLNPKWENKAMKLVQLKEEISANVQRIADDYEEICKIYADSPMLTAIAQRFEQTRDKGAALAYAAVLEKRDQLRREREQDSRVRLQAVIEEPAEAAGEAYAEAAEEITVPQTEFIGTVSFRVTCTRSRLIGLRDYMKTNGIKFEVIRQEDF